MLDGVVPPLLVAAAGAVLLWCRWLYLAKRPGHQWRANIAVGIAVVCLTGFLEVRMGQPLTYQSGPVRLWVGNVNSDQNSQQISDPYTLSHAIHGAAFYGLTHLALAPASLGFRAVFALTLEAMWEAYENTDTVINRYRSATIALGYSGDSVLNSMSDILACLVGFALASRWRWWWTVSWVAVTEIVLAVTIRDNLTLNIIMLIRPIEAIKHWQLGT
jgi:hypothetical protein